jgi:hypothetical protein
VLHDMPAGPAEEGVKLHHEGPTDVESAGEGQATGSATEVVVVALKTRGSEESAVASSFASWLQTQGWKTEREKRVGRVLVSNANEEAERMAKRTKPPPTPEDLFADASIGMPRKGGFSQGKIDVLGRMENKVWIAETKVEFSIGELAHGLGQALLYSVLLRMDEPGVGSLRRSVVFGRVRPGLTEDGEGSHGREILRGAAEHAVPLDVSVYLQGPDGIFERFP